MEDHTLKNTHNCDSHYYIEPPKLFENLTHPYMVVQLTGWGIEGIEGIGAEYSLHQSSKLLEH
jgi:hypothetical protein